MFPLASDADVLVQVVAKDIRDLHRITNAIPAIEGIARTSAAISLDQAIPYRPHALPRAVAESC